MYIQKDTHTHILTYTYTHTHTHTHIHTYIHIHTHTRTHTYIYIYIHRHTHATVGLRNPFLSEFLSFYCTEVRRFRSVTFLDYFVSVFPIQKQFAEIVSPRTQAKFEDDQAHELILMIKVAPSSKDTTTQDKEQESESIYLLF